MPLIRRHDGSEFQLQRDLTYTDPEGWSRWTGIRTIPVGTPEGRYTFRGCVVEDLVSGSCDVAAVNLLSQVKTEAYAIDYTPPSAVSGIPGFFGNATAIADLSTVWDDGARGSGFASNAANYSLKIDGVELPSRTATVPATLGNTTSTDVRVAADGSNIAQGVHAVTTTATDRAGNTATRTYLISLMTLAGSAADAMLRSVTVPVNPNGLVPPPTTIEFPAPQVDVPATTETMSSSVRVGTGSVNRTFSYGTLDVTFRTSSGTTTTVAVPVPTASYSHRIATIMPSAGPLKAQIPAQVASIPTLTVPVPTGFAGSGTTATLESKTTTLNPPRFEPGEILAGVLSGKVPLLGTIGVCMSGDATGVPRNGDVNCRVEPAVRVVVVGAPTDVSVPVDSVADDADDARTVQSCQLLACVQTAPLQNGFASFVVRCGSISSGEVSYNLCSGLPNTSPTASAWGAYLSAWVYGESAGSGENIVTRFPIWQQNHADNPAPDAGAPCPNGGGGKFRGLTYRLNANTMPFDEASGPIVSGLTNPSAFSLQHVYLGRATGNDSAGSPPADGSRSFQISNDGREHYAGIEFGAMIVPQGNYLAPATAARGPLGEILPGTGTASGWQFNSEPVASGQGLTSETQPDRSTRLRIITGTEYTTPGQDLGAFSLGATVAFQTVLDFGGCA